MKEEGEVALLGTRSEEEGAPLKDDDYDEPASSSNRPAPPEEDAVSEPSSSHSWRNLPSYVFKGYASSEADFTSDPSGENDDDDDDDDDAHESDPSI